MSKDFSALQSRGGSQRHAEQGSFRIPPQLDLIQLRTVRTVSCSYLSSLLPATSPVCQLADGLWQHTEGLSVTILGRLGETCTDLEGLIASSATKHPLRALGWSGVGIEAIWDPRRRIRRVLADGTQGPCSC